MVLSEVQLRNHSNQTSQSKPFKGVWWDNIGFHSVLLWYSCVKEKPASPLPNVCPKGFEITKMDLSDEADKSEGSLSNFACAKKCADNDKCVGYEWMRV